MTVDRVGPRRGRRAEQRIKRRKQRRRLAVGGVALLLVVAVIGLFTLFTGGGHSSRKVPVVKRTQRTVLFQLKGAAGTAVASALLAHDGPSKSGAVVLVPPQVLSQVPGVGSVAFGKALKTGSVAGSRNALADLMGVTIDGSWVVDVPTFQRLVDQEGGVQVKVDVAVLQGRTVLLQPGTQRLAGLQAVQFATYLAPTEQEQTRLARLQSVLDGVITGLPSSSKDLLRSLGPGSQSTVAVGDLSDLLTGLRKDDATDSLQYRSLPVIPVASGDNVVFRIDAPATMELVDELLAQSVPAGVRATGNRVLVLNGVGTPGLGAQVRDRLVPAGFVFVTSRNAPSFGYLKTQVLVKDASTAGAALGARVARALGVPASSVMTSDQIGTIADVVVIIGKDFAAK